MDSIIANIMIGIAALTLLVAAAVTIRSVWHSLRVNKRATTENGIPTRNITLSTVALPIVIAIPTLLFTSLADACIITATVLLFTASALVTCGRLRTLSRIRRRKNNTRSTAL